MLPYTLQELPLVAMALMIAFSVHEFAHAYVAYKFGDPTAQKQGRLTLSPLSHIDPIGAIAIFLVGFGWARPVPVNPHYFKRPRLAGVLVSVAGPLSNLVLGTIGLIVVYGLVLSGAMGALPEAVKITLQQFFEIFIGLNIMLFVFNLIPLPPLDGYRIIEDLMPTHIRTKMTQYERYGAIIFLVLVVTPLDRYTIQPIFHVVIPIVAESLRTFVRLLFGM